MSAPLYSVERNFPVGLERLWRAWTDASELQEWYRPVVLSVVPGSAVSEAHVGGHWKIAVDVPENDMVAYFWGRYLTVAKHAQLEHSMFYSQDQAEFVLADESGPNHRIVIDFADTPEGAWVRFTQIGEMPAEQIDATRMGMESYFDSLALHLESERA